MGTSENGRPNILLVVSDQERYRSWLPPSVRLPWRERLLTEGVELAYTPEGVRRLAEIAHSVNERTENIGARRLYTVMEKLLEEVSFDAGRNARRVVVDAAYVDSRLASTAQSEDLARYVL